MATLSLDSVSTRHRKGVVTAGWCSLSLSVTMIAADGHASSFELSIYEGTPILVWILLASAVVAGIAVLLSSPSPKDRKIFRSAIALLVIVNVVILLLPVFRGYPLYGRGDTLRHLGEMRYILEIGHIGELNFYYFIHLLGANVASVVGIPLNTTGYVLWTTFYLLYAIGLLLVYRSLFNNHYLAFVFSVPLVHVFLYPLVQPAFYTFTFIPTLYFLVRFREDLTTLRHRLLLVVLIIALIPAHPIALPVMLVLVFSSRIDGIVRQIGLGSPTQKRTMPILTVLAFISVVSWGAWYSHYFPLVGVFSDMINRIMYLLTSNPVFRQHTALANSVSTRSSGGSSTAIEQAIQLLGRKGFTPRQLVVLVTFRFGHLVLYYLALAVALVVGTVAARRFWLKRRTIELGAQLGLAGLVGLSFIFLPLVIGTFHRILRWSIFFLLLALPSVVIDLEGVFGNRDNLLCGLRICVLILVVSAAVIAQFGTYRAPQNGKVNEQITERKLAGTEWFQEYRNRDRVMMYSTADFWKLGQYYGYGVRNSKYEQPIPTRFGYMRTNLSNQIMAREQYILTTEMDRQFHYAYPVNVRHSLVKRYLPSDFDRLRAEPTIDRQYDNGGYTVWSSS